ncbi:hypothetical protein KCU95_g3684, partial [Aureobasidium melanogenum]
MAHPHGDMDPNTAAFILQLQRDELQAALSEGTAYDKVALQLQLEELNLVETAHIDTTEQQTPLDRSPLKPADSGIASLFSGMFAAGQSIYQALARQAPQNGAMPIDDLDNDQDDDNQPKSPFTCVACTDTFPWSNILETPCGHHYCIECLSELFELSMQDETLYPPRCCQQTIPLEEAKLVLDPKPIRNFEHKSIELDTKDRTYCFDPRCSTFIPAEHITDDVATCPGCGERSCAICKVAAHRGDCPRDENLQQLLQAAENQGWQRCYQCRRVVDLRSGCNHITVEHALEVRAAANLPARPAAPAVVEPARMARPVFDLPMQFPPAENAPVARPAVQLDPVIPVPVVRNAYIPPGTRRAAVPGPLLMPVRTARPAAQDAAAIHQQRLVAQIREDLRRNHECDHERWTCHRGRHRCEECNHMLPHYIFECRQCHIRACQRCCRNRF